MAKARFHEEEFRFRLTHFIARKRCTAAFMFAEL
jgi:hypothetical protein